MISECVTSSGTQIYTESPKYRNVNNQITLPRIENNFSVTLHYIIQNIDYVLFCPMGGLYVCHANA